ncbi:type I-C CRISPR-associated protein Cas8c/Csd1 [Solwaraspora sp. WMMA2065]|uniref:type I-C CRISPR-associated protein Cas8c/Csd1 n=1 Tax=Solwaraspora sp. WMMA2065 TaxID=3015166 RepID=UPI00259B4543|nr:type I-C CRISPR-associated protein Cas8c/Csd1 [Solwaraspora sp. WMMA2065]WJK36295.1 type I-C CRISPR-associated protein Cas8c/Csd1 [Solwaraspora sp. WMMA2065]
MLLQRLVEFAATSDDVLPPFYGRKPVRLIVDIDRDGGYRGQTDTASDAAGARIGIERSVPAVTRTVGIAPTLAVDNVEYALGWVADGGKADRIGKQHDAFVELIRDWAEAEPDGPGPAVAAFYRRRQHHKVQQPDKWGRADMVGIRVGGEFAFEHDSARRYWATVAAGRKGLGRAGRCLVCGEVRDLLKTIPQQIPQRLLPGATQGASLVSVNEAVHGYELTKFLGNTPICVTCGLTFMSSLTVLLSDTDHHASLPGQNARLTWWVIGGASFDPMGPLDQEDEKSALDMIVSPTRGTEATVDDLSKFCSVTVSGNVARVVVRDWVEMPLPAVKANLRRWIDDHKIAGWDGKPTLVKLVQLTRVAGRWQPGRGSGPGSWTKLGARGEDRPGGLYHALWRSAVFGAPLPPKILAHVIDRIRTDGRVDAARVALIRLAVLRRPGLPPYHAERLTPTLNDANRDPAYLSGRAFAVLDDLQQAVYRAANQQLNTTFAERYMGRAITNPQAVLVNGRRSATAWLRRLRGPLGKPAWAGAYANRLDDIFAQIDADTSIPSSAMLTQKAAFVLGYHHQRAAMRAERIEAAASKKNTDLPPADLPPGADGTPAADAPEGDAA